MFFLLCPCCTAQASGPKYIKEYPDLSPREKKVMDNIYHIIDEKESHVFVDVNITNKEFLNIIDAIDSTWLPFDGYAYQFMYSVNMKDNGNICYIVVQPPKLKKCYNKNMKCKAIAKKWAKQCVKKGMSTGQKRDAIGKYLAKKMSYSPNIHSAAIALKKKRGACDVYSTLYNYMCKGVGIDSVRCCLSKYHEWNTMKIGKKRYYIDVTFYDTGGKESKYLHMTKLREKAHKLLKRQSKY